MTALSSHLPAFSFFGGSLFFSGGLFLSRCCFSSSRQQTFFFFGGSLFFSGGFFLSRCCFLLFPPANFLFLRQFSFSPPAAFLVPLPFFFSLLQAFSFFGGSLFRSAVFFVPQRFSSVFFRVGAFRPPLFRGLKYCKRSDKKKAAAAVCGSRLSSSRGARKVCVSRSCPPIPRNRTEAGSVLFRPP